LRSILSRSFGPHALTRISLRRLQPSTNYAKSRTNASSGRKHSIGGGGDLGGRHRKKDKSSPSSSSAGKPTTTSASNHGSGNGGSGSDEGLAFGLGDADFDESNDGDEPGVPDAPAQSSSRRGGSSSTSPRPPGAVSSERQHYNRRVTERAGSGSISADFASNNDSSRPLLAERWQRDVPHGVLRVVCGDFNHDGVRELIVVTKRNVHVFHPDYREEADRFAKTMYALKMLQPKEDEDEEEEEEDVGGGSLSNASERGE